MKRLPDTARLAAILSLVLAVMLGACGEPKAPGDAEVQTAEQVVSQTTEPTLSEASESATAEADAAFARAVDHYLAGAGHAAAAHRAQQAGDQGQAQAENDLAESQFDEAIALFEHLLEEDPGHVSALTNLGIVYYTRGDLSEAIAKYQLALELAPEDADIHSNLGAAYVQSGQLDKAVDEYETAVDLDDKLAQAYFGLGVVYLQLGRNDEARAAFERFQELDDGLDALATQEARRYLEMLEGN